LPFLEQSSLLLGSFLRFFEFLLLSSCSLFSLFPQFLLLKQTHFSLHLLILKPYPQLTLLNSHHFQLPLSFPLFLFSLLLLLASLLFQLLLLNPFSLVNDCFFNLPILFFERSLDKSGFDLDEEEIIVASNLKLHFLLFVD
jgi:hypothetical protein